MAEKCPSDDVVKMMDQLHPPAPDDLESRLAYQQQMEIAQVVHDARTRSGLTQTQFAQKVGLAESVIADLEDAEYAGNAMMVLGRIAEALGLRVQISVAPRNAA